MPESKALPLPVTSAESPDVNAGKKSVLYRKVAGGHRRGEPEANATEEHRPG